MKSTVLFIVFISNLKNTTFLTIAFLSNCSPVLAGNPTAALSIHNHTCTLQQDLYQIFGYVKLAFTNST